MSEIIKEQNKKLLPGRGLDVGTSMLVSCSTDENGEVYTKSIRDSFLEIKPANKLVYGTMKKSLTKAGVNFFETDGVFNILGEDSLIQSVERQLILNRPMSKGIISPKEAKALPMFKALLKELLGEPQIENEKIIYSVPASPLSPRISTTLLRGSYVPTESPSGASSTIARSASKFDSLAA